MQWAKYTCVFLFLIFLHGCSNKNSLPSNAPNWIIKPNINGGKICEVGSSPKYNKWVKLPYENNALIVARGTLAESIKNTTHSIRKSFSMHNLTIVDSKLEINSNISFTESKVYNTWISKDDIYYVLLCINIK